MLSLRKDLLKFGVEFEKIHTMLEEMKMFLFKVLLGLFLVPFGVMGLVLMNL